MRAVIEIIQSYLPAATLSNEELAREFPDWTAERIAGKTGIERRHIAAPGEYASDLAVRAAERVFADRGVGREAIDYLLLCTQSPDHLLPTTACLLQQRLGLRKDIGALDFNLGCSGYVYGLGLANGLIRTGQATKVLLLTADTYTKFIAREDRALRTLFGDGATATVVGGAADGRGGQPAYVYGTDGGGGEHLRLRSGGVRGRETDAAAQESLWMNGPEVFHFAIKVVPGCVERLLRKAGLAMADVDLFVFHQANRHMLDALRVRMGIAEERFWVSMAECGNTVSGTIPLALESALAAGRLRVGDRVVLVGFGVGLSWGATVLTWPGLDLMGLEPGAADATGTPDMVR